MSDVSDLTSAEDVAEVLKATGYLSDEGLATIAYLALAMDRPLLLEGEPGTGKTALAEALAEGLNRSLIRLQCYEGIDASQALYDWDFSKQILHLRALEAAAVTAGTGARTAGTGARTAGTGARSGAVAGAGAGANDPRDEAATTSTAAIEESLFDERFLLDRPILRALRNGPAVLLIDEIDRADDEFEAFLLEVLSARQVTIPELGTIRPEHPPIVVLTSNRTRELHDALKRRCLYHWIDHPGLDREVAIVRARLPHIPERLAAQVVAGVQRLRTEADLIKPPGVAETLDWARALNQLGNEQLDLGAAAATVGTICKHREDLDRVRASLDRLLAT